MKRLTLLILSSTLLFGCMESDPVAPAFESEEQKQAAYDQIKDDPNIPSYAKEEMLARLRGEKPSLDAQEEASVQAVLSDPNMTPAQKERAIQGIRERAAQRK